MQSKRRGKEKGSGEGIRQKGSNERGKRLMNKEK